MSDDFYGNREEVMVSKILIRNEDGELLILKKSSVYDCVWQISGSSPEVNLKEKRTASSQHEER